MKGVSQKWHQADVLTPSSNCSKRMPEENTQYSWLGGSDVLVMHRHIWYDLLHLEITSDELEQDLDPAAKAILSLGRALGNTISLNLSHWHVVICRGDGMFLDIQSQEVI